MSYALVTGASSGIGRHYTLLLAQRGYNIIAVSNQAAELEAVTTEAEQSYGIRAIPLVIDLSSPDAAQWLFEYTESEGLQVEILICNAGMLLFSTMLNTSPERLATIVALHCTTTTLLCRYFGQRLKERGHGRILIMSSATAWLPYPTISHYAATKAYLKSFASSLWYELRPYGVSVTTIFPGAVDTPFYSLGEGARRPLRLLGVMLKAETIARRGLRAMFRGRRRLVPGLFTKIVVAICALLPARLLYPLLRIGPIKRLIEHL